MVTRQKNQEITVITTMMSFLDGLSGRDCSRSGFRSHPEILLILLSFRRDFPVLGMCGRQIEGSKQAYARWDPGYFSAYRRDSSVGALGR